MRASRLFDSARRSSTASCGSRAHLADELTRVMIACTPSMRALYQFSSADPGRRRKDRSSQLPYSMLVLHRLAAIAASAGVAPTYQTISRLNEDYRGCVSVLAFAATAAWIPPDARFPVAVGLAQSDARRYPRLARVLLSRQQRVLADVLAAELAPIEELGLGAPDQALRPLVDTLAPCNAGRSGTGPHPPAHGVGWCGGSVLESLETPQPGPKAIRFRALVTRPACRAMILTLTTVAANSGSAPVRGLPRR